MTALVTLVFVAGCAVFGPAPDLDTNEKKLAAAEITFQEASKTARRLHPRLSQSNRDKVFDLLEDAHKALEIARIAITAGDELNFSSSIATVNTLLRVLRPLLEQLEEAEVSYGYGINSPSYS